VKSSSKKVAANLFILQRGASPLSSAPVWAEPSQLLIGIWVLPLICPTEGAELHVNKTPYFKRTAYVRRSSVVRALVIASRHARYTGPAAVPPLYKERSAEQFASRY
jgi:hypothetical protein